MSDAIYADPEVRRLREARVPLGRLGTAEDVADTVLFLASPKAGYVPARRSPSTAASPRTALASMPRPRSVDSVGVTDTATDTATGTDGPDPGERG